jgi:aspartyl-tRNA(Asn)/glutamyl-tRNA(Gln) amidotransferase subunit C
MMRMSDNEMSRLEALARIQLETGEREMLRIQLAHIIGFLHRLDVSDIGEDDVPEEKLAIPGILRLDEVRDCLERDVVLEQAPDRAGGHFRVPAVIDGEEDSPRK